uniref:Uncharacterized protein n=1 Tax=Anguilla anguilla TaxID=7936 RepID=A0A0E9XKW6_ANGAN
MIFVLLTLTKYGRMPLRNVRYACISNIFCRYLRLLKEVYGSLFSMLNSKFLWHLHFNNGCGKAEMI